MDWPESTQPLIVGLPRGRERNGNSAAGLVDEARLAGHRLKKPGGRRLALMEDVELLTNDPPTTTR